MDIQVSILHEEIMVSEPTLPQKYFIVKCPKSDSFYVVSDADYFKEYKGDGFKNLEKAIKSAKKLVLNDYWRALNTPKQ